MNHRRFDYESTDSTSERAFDALERGAALHGDLHVARTQTSGRGTRGRTWFSPPGSGLYASLVWLPPPPPLSPAALTMAAGLAVLAGLRSVGLKRARLKWPNDVVVDGAKLAGVLIETRGLDPSRPHYVIGIGVNVGQLTFPPELEAERRVTSLAKCGVKCSVAETLDAILAHLSSRLDQWDHPELGRAFLEETDLAGRDVTVQIGGSALDGVLIDLSMQRGLVLLAHGDDEERFVPIESVSAVRARS